MISPFQIGCIILGVLLAVSAAGNAWLFRERTALLVRDGTVTQLAADTKAAASACSASVEGLDKAGKQRQRDLIAALKGIAPQVARGQQEALSALAAKPDDPQDLCGSAQRYIARELAAERGKP